MPINKNEIGMFDLPRVTRRSKKASRSAIEGVGECDCEHCTLGRSCASLALSREAGAHLEVEFGTDVGWGSDEHLIRKLSGY